MREFSLWLPKVREYIERTMLYIVWLGAFFVHVFPMDFHECLSPPQASRAGGAGTMYFFIFNPLRGVPLGGGFTPEKFLHCPFWYYFMVTDVILLK